MQIILIALLVNFMLIFGGCTTYQRCQDKYGQIATDTVYTVDSTRVITRSDSIRHILDTSRYVVKETERTRLVVHKDTVVCTSKADTVHHYVRTTQIQHKPIFIDKDPRVLWWQWLLIGLGSGLVFVVLLKLLR